jgi:superfamily II RNA helicase
VNNKIPNLTLDTLFPFPLDDFQKQAIASVAVGKSVVVCAPTGSGKTLIAEYAIYRALSLGKRVFYTTPLKALSNQKLRDFQDKFTSDAIARQFRAECGLITGDIIINPDANVVVMTTEIFRNMLYETPIGQVGTSLENVETVILDECHYISDRGRGTVWEESIIYCPPTIQLIALSATIGNPEELTDWINQVRTTKNSAQKALISTCDLINSNFRPVPLSFYFSTQKGLFPLLNAKQNKLNAKLQIPHNKKTKTRLKREDCPTIFQIVKQLQEKQMLPAIYVIFSRRGCYQATNQLRGLNLLTYEESQDLAFNLLIFFFAENPRLQASQASFLDFLAQENAKLLQKLTGFISNNKQSQIELLDYLEENPPIKSFLFRQLALHFQLFQPEQIDLLTQGVAAHHAGVLPAFKELVEQLFEIGLIKVVFATATLSAGINMPAKTTVISALSKRTDEGHSMLSPSEFLQIAGRAGRRGMDEQGYVVTVQTPFEGAKEAAFLATATPEPLKSWFAPSYGMVLNLLQKHSLDEAKDLLEKSFAEYLAQLKLAPEKEAITTLTTELAKLDIELAAISDQEIRSYRKLKQRIKEEKRQLKIRIRQAQTTRKQQIAALFSQLQPGNILHIKGKHIKVATPVTAVFVAFVPGPGKAEDLLCLGENNRWYMVAQADVVDINPSSLPSAEIINLTMPMIEKVILGPWRKGDELTLTVSQKIKDFVTEIPEPKEVSEQQQKLEELQNKLNSHPLQKQKNPAQILARYQDREELRDQLHHTQNRYQNQQSRKSYYWEDFLRLIEILQEFKALDGYNPTTLGVAAATVRGENELWLGLVFISGELDHLESAQLASAVSALITETLRPDTWTNYLPAPEVIEAFQHLGKEDISLTEMRRKLYQAQHKRFISIPIWFEDELMGLVEAWALGTDWTELCENTNLDEGDIVRLLRRTLDLLLQIPQTPGVSEMLKLNARVAIEQMKRFPV